MNKPEDLFSDFSLLGMFWKPSAPEKQLPGELSFSNQEGPRLRLYGMFDDDGFRQGTVFGLAEGRPCTLHKCFHHGSTMHLTDCGMQRFSRFSAIHLFLGAHFDPATARFRSMKVSFTSLEEWYMHAPFKTTLNESRTATALFTPFECPKTDVPGINANVAFDYSANLDLGSFTELSWKARLLISVKPTEPQLYSDYFSDQRRNLKHLLSLLIGEPVYPKITQLYLQCPNKEQEPFIELFSRDKTATNKNVSGLTMLVTFPKIQSKWGEILKSWFDVCLQFKSPLRLFFSRRYAPLNVQSDFLRLMQSIESFHRLKDGGVFMPHLEYEEKITKPLLAALPADIDSLLKESLASRIRFGNELSLRKRLRAILTALPPQILKLVNFDEITDSIDQLVDDRNYLTHFTTELESKSSETMELWDLEKAIEVILEYLFLKEAGVSEDVFLTRLSEQRFLWFNQPK